jgi:hypothetical protein
MDSRITTSSGLILSQVTKMFNPGIGPQSILKSGETIGDVVTLCRYSSGRTSRYGQLQGVSGIPDDDHGGLPLLYAAEHYAGYKAGWPGTMLQS